MLRVPVVCRRAPRSALFALRVVPAFPEARGLKPEARLPEPVPESPAFLHLATRISSDLPTPGHDSGYAY